MAISKLKPRHLRDGISLKQYLSDRIDYGTNPEKTEGGELVTAYQCSPESAADEFVVSKQIYHSLTKRSQPKEHDIISYVMFQSFAPGEISPEEAHQLAYDLALEFTQGQHQFVVATHTDKEHIHSHIEFNSTTLDCTHKFNNVRNSALILQKINDRLCEERGLSVIREPKKKGKHYAQWKAEKSGTSYKANLQNTIDRVLPDCKSFGDFLARMRLEGYEVEHRRQLKFRAAGQERFTRSRTLGEAYSEEKLREKILMQRGRKPTARPAQSRRNVNLLIDIQSKIMTGKGGGYERWAKIFNLKEAARTLNFLTENGITDYGELAEKAKQSAEKFHAVSARMKQLEGQMTEVADLKYHIIKYSKTREIYQQYRKASDKAAFRLEHAEAIAQHEAAKAVFDGLGGKSIPKVADLQAEYSRLLAEKQSLRADHEKLRQTMTELKTAQQNVELLLSLDTPPEPEQNKAVNRQEER